MREISSGERDQGMEISTGMENTNMKENLRMDSLMEKEFFSSRGKCMGAPGKKGPKSK